MNIRASSSATASPETDTEAMPRFDRAAARARAEQQRAALAAARTEWEREFADATPEAQRTMIRRGVRRLRVAVAREKRPAMRHARNQWAVARQGPEIARLIDKFAHVGAKRRGTPRIGSASPKRGDAVASRIQCAAMILLLRHVKKPGRKEAGRELIADIMGMSAGTQKRIQRDMRTPGQPQLTRSAKPRTDVSTLKRVIQDGPHGAARLQAFLADDLLAAVRNE